MGKWSTCLGMMTHPGFSEIAVYNSFITGTSTLKVKRDSDLEINYMTTDILAQLV